MEGETGDEVVSMVDVLQEDNDLEEEANAVLGDSDDQCCTYSRVSRPSRPCTCAENTTVLLPTRGI